MDVNAYDGAERSYLDALRSGAPREKLASAARHVCETARSWESAAYQEFFAKRRSDGETARSVIEKEIEAEKAELLCELWNDIAAAYDSSG